VNELNEISGERIKTGRIWMAIVLGSLTGIGPLSIDMYLPSLPTLTNDLHTTASLAQLSLTACLLGISLGQLFVGPISDMRGRRKPLMIALIIYAITSLLCAFIPSIWGLITLRFIQGVTGSAGIVIARATVRDLYSGTALTKFFSLLMLINGIAPILAPIIGGQLLKFTNWHGVFIVLCVASLLMLLMVFFSLPETLVVENRLRGGVKGSILTFRNLVKDKKFMGFALAQGLIIAAMFAYISGSPFVIQNVYGATPQTYSIIFATNGLGIIIASQVTGRLAGKIKEMSLFKFGLGYATVGGLSLLIATYMKADLVFILIPLFMIVSSVGITGTTSFSLAMENQSKAAGSASALLGASSFILGAIVAPLVGIAGGNTALPMGIIIAICEISAVITYFVLIRQKENSTPIDYSNNQVIGE